jgi:hypothetical protein
MINKLIEKLSFLKSKKNFYLFRISFFILTRKLVFSFIVIYLIKVIIFFERHFKIEHCSIVC